MTKLLNSIKTILNEKLEPHEEDEVMYGWDHTRPEHTQEAIDKVFHTNHAVNTGRIEFPLDQTESVPHPDVEEHLNKNGYIITNYLDGKAKDKYNRETNIGKALTKTNAPDQVKQAFANDESRQQNKSKMKIVISHHPVDVAGMTSSHQSWVDHSCMNFRTGSNRHYLQDEVKEGTHVAYLTDSEDKDLDRPVARIAIKPYHDPYSDHTIFRPEDKVWGNANSSFQKQVSDWCEDSYPGKDNVEYEKNRNVYDDTGNKTYTSMTKEKAMDNIAKGYDIRSAIPKHVVAHIADSMIKEHQANPDSQLMNMFARSSHTIAFNRNQVNALYKVAREHNQTSMLHHLQYRAGDVLNKENLEHAVSDKENIATSVLKHRYLPSHVVDSLEPNRYKYVHPANIKDHHVDKLVSAYNNGDSGSWANLTYNSKNLKSKHLNDMVNGKFSDPLDKSSGLKRSGFGGRTDITFIMNHPLFNDEVKSNLFNKLKNPSLSHELMNEFNKHNTSPTPENVAVTSDHSGLFHILHNAKDKLTHALAFNKQQNMHVEGDWGTGATLSGENQNKFLSDKDIEHIYDNPDKFAMASVHKDIADRLIRHSMKQIDDVAKAHDSQDTLDLGRYDADNNISRGHDIQNLAYHFERHADLINDQLSDIEQESRKDDGEIDDDHLASLENHIYHAKNHPLYGDHADNSHDIAEDTVQNISHNIENRHYNNDY